ncbi:MAG: glycosyltransferase family 39 protein [Candidatus Promineifilaceae bacterium]
MEILLLQQRQKILILLILLAAATLRITHIGGKSLWFDEAYSVAEAQLPQEAIWAAEPARTDSHPPLYYSALHYWIAKLGTSEMALRLPSAFISVLSIALIYALGCRLGAPDVALLAALLLAVSPLDLWYAQEARMYIFLAFIILLAVALQLRASWWLAIPLTLVLVTGFYIDYTMLALWLGMSAFWLYYWRVHEHSVEPLLIWSAASLLALLLYIPWRATFLAWLANFDRVTVYLELSKLTGLPALSNWQYLLAAVASVVLLLMLMFLLRRALHNEKILPLLTIVVVGGYVLLNFLFIVPRFYSLKRLLVQAWPAVILFVAWIILQSRRGRHLATMTILASLIAAVILLVFVQKDDWRGAVTFINRHATAADVALLEHPWNQKVTRYYGLKSKLVSLEFLEDSIAPPKPGNVWYIAERFPGQMGAKSVKEQWLDQNLEAVAASLFTRLEVSRFTYRSGPK